MNLAERLFFGEGGCNTQQTLPFGSIEAIQEEVRKRIKIFAPGGGFVFATVHNIQYGTPPENILAMCDTVFEFGRY